MPGEKLDDIRVNLARRHDFRRRRFEFSPVFFQRIYQQISEEGTERRIIFQKRIFAPAFCNFFKFGKKQLVSFYLMLEALPDAPTFRVRFPIDLLGGKISESRFYVAGDFFEFRK